MTIRLLYFAAVRELVGRVDEEVTLPAPTATVGDLAAWLPAHQPSLRGQLAQVRWARNQAFAALDERLHDGDVVAVLPPVAGG